MNQFLIKNIVMEYLFLFNVKIFNELLEAMFKPNSIWMILLSGLLIIGMAIFHKYNNNAIPSLLVESAPEIDAGSARLIDVKIKCKEYVEKGRTEDAVQLLISQLKIKSIDDKELDRLYKDVLQVSNRLERINHDKIHNLAPLSEINTEMNQVTHAVIHLIDRLG